MKTVVLKHKYDEIFNEHEKQRYHDFLASLSDNIRFEDDTWICEKRMKRVQDMPNDVSIRFTQIPVKYKTMMKYCAIILFIQGKGVSSVHREIDSICIFLRFIGDDDLQQINVLTASRFKEYLDSEGYVESTRAKAWSDVSRFLTLMNGYDGMTFMNPFSVNIYRHEKRHDYKYIPEYVVRQLDSAFKDDIISIQLRCIYWLLRLIPSRISEVLGMKIDCLKSFDGHYCIFIPTWKQNGGYREPIMRVVHVNDEGMGGYLLSLIREQQKIAMIYQEFMPDDKKNALFTYRKMLKQTLLDEYRVATKTHVSYWFERICEDYNIRDEHRNIYNVTSHQFRHNGITDRLRAGFTLPQIAEMTGHHGTAMIFASYAHLDLFPETLIEPNNYTMEKSSDGNPYVLFVGKILNMDAINESRLLSNLRAHRIPGGICADVTHCKSNMWDCLRCKHFIPEKEQLPYFKEQVLAWREKALRFRNDAVLHVNFIDIAVHFEKIIKKLEMEDIIENG